MQVIAHLEPLQQRYSGIMADEGYLDSILAQGAGRLSTLSPVPAQHSYSALTKAPLQTWRVSIKICPEFCDSSLMSTWRAEKAEEAAGRTLDNVRQVKFSGLRLPAIHSHAPGCAYLELCIGSQTLLDACAGHGLCSKTQTLIRQFLGWHLACCTEYLEYCCKTDYHKKDNTDLTSSNLIQQAAANV